MGRSSSGFLAICLGTQTGQLKDLLPGAIKSSHPREVREAGREACLLYEDLERVFHRLMVAYQHTPHQGLRGMTPHEKWMEGMEGSVPVVPVVPVVPALTPGAAAGVFAEIRRDASDQATRSESVWAA